MSGSEYFQITEGDRHISVKMTNDLQLVFDLLPSVESVKNASVPNEDDRKELLEILHKLESLRQDVSKLQNLPVIDADLAIIKQLATWWEEYPSQDFFRRVQETFPDFAEKQSDLVKKMWEFHRLTWDAAEWFQNLREYLGYCDLLNQGQESALAVLPSF